MCCTFLKLLKYVRYHVDRFKNVDANISFTFGDIKENDNDDNYNDKCFT